MAIVSRKLRYRCDMRSASDRSTRVCNRGFIWNCLRHTVSSIVPSNTYELKSDCMHQSLGAQILSRSLQHGVQIGSIVHISQSVYSKKLFKSCRWWSHRWTRFNIDITKTGKLGEESFKISSMVLIQNRVHVYGRFSVYRTATNNTLVSYLGANW